ncbi:MAG: hypothetical protein ACK4OM_03590 [Alphaproteobacteria bacterium]
MSQFYNYLASTQSLFTSIVWNLDPLWCGYRGQTFQYIALAKLVTGATYIATSLYASDEYYKDMDNFYNNSIFVLGASFNSDSFDNFKNSLNLAPNLIYGNNVLQLDLNTKLGKTLHLTAGFLQSQSLRFLVHELRLYIESRHFNGEDTQTLTNIENINLSGMNSDIVFHEAELNI